MKLLLLIIVGVVAATMEESELLTNFSAGNAQFSADIYKELEKTNSGNFLVSPVSVQINLALVYAGALGKTATELASGLHLLNNQEQNQIVFEELTKVLKSNHSYTLSAANKVYVQNGYKIKDQFKKTAVKSFDAEIENIDFVKSEESASEINRWVEEKTHHRIKNLVSADDLDSNTRCVLINALYFNGTWLYPFSDSLTSKRYFYVDEHTKIEVDMMQRTTFFNYAHNKELKCKYLELPYEGDDVTMTLVLPDDKYGLPALESRLADVLIHPKYSEINLAVSIPKFKIESNLQLKPILQALGVVDAFGNAADFSGLLETTEPLEIAKVVQKTFIEVHEKGTEASAGTGTFLVFYSKPQEFIADHPFIFYIKHKDVVLFIGRYSLPEV